MLLSGCVVLVTAFCLIPGALVTAETDPLCVNKVCGAAETCRVEEVCKSPCSCSSSPVCIGEVNSLGGGCIVGQPQLKKDASNGDYTIRSCHTSDNCNDGFYCSTELMDTIARCCRANPVPVIKKGTCPDLQAANSPVCVDECRSDADCRWSYKCCRDNLVCSRKVCKHPRRL